MPWQPFLFSVAVHFYIHQILFEQHVKKLILNQKKGEICYIVAKNEQKREKLHEF